MPSRDPYASDLPATAPEAPDRADHPASDAAGTPRDEPAPSDAAPAAGIPEPLLQRPVETVRPTVDETADGPEQPTEPAQPTKLRARMAAPISKRHLRLGAVAGALAVAVFTSGWAVGAHDPLLAPVQLAPAPQSAGPTTPERVYSVVKDAVVTLRSDGGVSGTGFFYRPDRIITNHHVVATADAIRALANGDHPKVTVTLADGRVRIGSVRAVDSRLDIAIIDVPSGLGIRPLAFADSSRIQPGEPAIVVGAPFGLGTSVSSGIISGRDRSTQFSADPVQNELIQTDAAVNPGNSGGPLLTETATVAGIVTLRPDEANGRSAQGIAFALPSKVVVPAIDQLERYGKVSHPQLGVFLESAEEDDGSRTVVITKVAPGSPAERAGLRAGDRVRAVDQTETRTPTDVIDAVTGKRAGDDVTVTVRRAGTSMSTKLTLRERPDGS